MTSTNMYFDIFGRDKGVKSMFQEVEGSSNHTAAAIGGLGAAAAVGLGGVALGAKKSVEAYEEQAKAVFELREATGGTAEDVSKFNYALNSVGLTADDVRRPITTFSKVLESAAGDAGKHAELVQKLGFEYQDANGKIMPINELMPKVIEKFAGMEDGAEKNALGAKLFGKTYADMLPMLNAGAAEFKANEDAAAANGAVLSGPAVDAARAQALEQKQLDLAMRGVFITIGQSLMPMLEGMTHFLTGSVVPGIQAVTGWFRGLSPEMQQLVAVIGTAVIVGGPLVLLIGKLAGAITSTINVVKDIKEAWIALNVVMDANFIAVVVIAIAAFVASLIWAYNNVGWFKDFVDGAFHLIQDIIGNVINFITGTLVPNLIAGWNDTMTIVGVVADFITSAFNNVSSNIAGFVGAVIGFFSNLGQNVQNIWNGMVNGVQTAVGRVGDFFRNLPGNILGYLGNLGGLLVNAGSQIIGGLISGLQGALGGLGDVLANVGNFIASHKGPEEYDKNLLVPHGGWIMGGLMSGIWKSMPQLSDTLGHVSDMISGAVEGASVDITGKVSGGGAFAPAWAGIDNVRTTAQVDLSGHELVLNADATKAMFVRTAQQSAADAINSANDDLYRGRAR